MESQITQVMNELFNILLKVSVPAAFLRLAVAGLKHLAGDGESVSTALRQVGIGLFVIITAKTTVSLIQGFAEAVAVFQGGW